MTGDTDIQNVLLYCFYYILVSASIVLLVIVK